MVFSLAPKASSNGRFQIRSTAVRMSETRICSVKQLPSVFSADSWSFLPMKIDARGAPPVLMSAANAETIMIIGRHTPTPVSAREPSPGICPI